MISRPRLVVLGAVALIVLLVVGCGSRWLAGGKLHFDQQRYEQALENFEKAVEEKPNDPEGRLWLGRALAQLERDEEAVQEINNAAELSTGDAELDELIANTRISYWSARYNSGIAYATDADEARARAAGHEVAGETQLAEEAAAKADEKLTEAVERFERAILYCPDSVKNYSNLGKVLFQLGRRDEGMAMFEKTRQLAGDRPDLQSFLFRVYQTLGIRGMEEGTEEGLKTAIEMFEQALTFKITPQERAAINFNIGVAQARLAEIGPGAEREQRYREAIEAYGRVLAHNPEDMAALTNLAYVYDELEDHEKALSTAQLLLDVEPWNQELHFVLVRLYNASDQRDKSAAHLILQDVLQRNSPSAKTGIRETATGYGPGSDMLKTLRERGEPEQLYKYSGSHGEYLIWFYWTSGRVYIFQSGKEVFSAGFKSLSDEKAREIMGQ
jgi:tetratricopeptide (TPR) repeat protein